MNTIIPGYTGRRDGGPEHIKALVEYRLSGHDAHVRDWEDHCLSGNYADMYMVEHRRGPFRVIASASWLGREYPAADYSWRLLTTTEMWLAELADNAFAKRHAEEERSVYRTIYGRERGW